MGGSQRTFACPGPPERTAKKMSKTLERRLARLEERVPPSSETRHHRGPVYRLGRESHWNPHVRISVVPAPMAVARFTFAQGPRLAAKLMDDNGT